MPMSTAKIAITIEEDLLGKLDQLVSTRVFPNRSKAIQEAVREKLGRMNRSRLARECAKLDPSFEKAMAEEGLSLDVREWPEY
jgi:metal-responsive CopG/Arc/MetJ family transcriptional regulator